MPYGIRYRVLIVFSMVLNMLIYTSPMLIAMNYLYSPMLTMKYLYRPMITMDNSIRIQSTDSLPPTSPYSKPSRWFYIDRFEAISANFCQVYHPLKFIKIIIVNHTFIK